MALQVVEGKIGFVVEFEELPELPVTGHHMEKPFAEALTDAIRNNIITEGGKYFIYFTDQAGLYARYEVASIVE